MFPAAAPAPQYLALLSGLAWLCPAGALQMCARWKGIDQADSQVLGTQWAAYLMRMMTEGVWAMAPIRLHTHITQRKVRKASWHPGLGHFPGTTVAFSGGTVVRHAQPVRFWKGRFSRLNWGCLWFPHPRQSIS